MTEKPFQSPNYSLGEVADSEPNLKPSISTDRAVYNVVSDTLTGVNVRWSDNKFQAIFVCVSVVVCSVIGAVVAAVNSSWNLPWYGGAIIGSFAGLVVGIISSGVFLMIYRATKHLKGEHD